ncbi:MAG: hypothetical protein JO115_11945 [Pseudonocardiales bacterium]|nr:hypothetical protein [Pseudonocardiales bacterium]
MTAEEKTLLAVLTTAAVLVPIALGAALSWPAWSWLFLAVPLLGALGLVARNIRRRVRDELPRQQAAPPLHGEQQHEAWQTPIPDTCLLSTIADYNFHFSATAYWRLVEGATIQHADPGGLAARVIVDRAQAIAATEHPDNVDVLRHRLTGELGTVWPDTSGVVEAWADQIQLTLSEADRERLRRYSEVRKDGGLWECERNHEILKRTYLGEALTSMGSTVTWWLARKDNDVENTVRLLDALAQLCAAANRAEVPELVPNGSFPGGSPQSTWFPPAGLAAGPFSDVRLDSRQWIASIDELNLDSDHRALLARRIAVVLEKAGKPDLAQEIQRHFDAPATDQEPAEFPKPDGDLPDEPTLDGEPPW